LSATESYAGTTLRRIQGQFVVGFDKEYLNSVEEAFTKDFEKLYSFLQQQADKRKAAIDR
jgi:hypothetical protein